MDNRDHVIFSYAFDEQGKAQKLDNQKIAQELKNEGLAWVNLNANSSFTKPWLEKEVSYLDHLIIDALIAEETRPRIVEFESGIMIIVRSVNSNEGAEPEDMVSIRIWIDACRIITVQRRQMKAVSDFAEEIASGKSIKNSGEFLYSLLYSILSEITSCVYGITEVLDVLEEKVTSSHDVKFRERITDIRSKSAVFKRYLTPQKEVIRKLQNIDQAWVDDWSKRHFQENYDSIIRIIEEAEEARDRSQILHDELSNALSEKLNRSMYKLSIIASIFMPLTFVTGIFGMNIAGLPGLKDPDAFNLSMFAMLLIFLLQVFFFKRGKMF